MRHQYRIDFKNLSPSTVYEFEFLLEDSFFEQFDTSEILHGNVNAHIELLHLASAYELKFHIDGVVAVMCDRCLDDVEIPVEADDKLIVTLGKSYEEVNEEHIIVPESESAIDVTWLMYEFILLALPMRRVHDDGLCNKEMEQKLKELSPNIEDN